MHYELALEFNPTLVLRDRENGEVKRLWSGSVAANILASGVLPPFWVQGGRYRCDKSLVWRLMLTATAVGLARGEQARDASHESSFGNESIREKLLRHGVHPTAQRVRVARALFDGVASHYTPHQVCAKLKAAGDRCCRATVYNCLKLFADKKLLQEVVVERDLVFYDTVTAPHAHVYNVETGELSDLHLDLGLPKLPVGTVVEGAHLVWLVRSSTRRNGLGTKANEDRVRVDQGELRCLDEGS